MRLLKWWHNVILLSHGDTRSPPSHREELALLRSVQSCSFYYYRMYKGKIRTPVPTQTKGPYVRTEKTKSDRFGFRREGPCMRKGTLSGNHEHEIWPWASWRWSMHKARCLEYGLRRQNLTPWISCRWFMNKARCLKERPGRRNPPFLILQRWSIERADT